MASGWDADQGRGDVVGRVERERELRGFVGTVLGAQQVGGAEDQQRRGDVAQLKRADGAEQAAELALQHWPDLEQRTDDEVGDAPAAGDLQGSGERERLRSLLVGLAPVDTTVRLVDGLALVGRRRRGGPRPAGIPGSDRVVGQRVGAQVACLQREPRVVGVVVDVGHLAFGEAPQRWRECARRRGGRAFILR